jgi:hypothetical protein
MQPTKLHLAANTTQTLSRAATYLLPHDMEATLEHARHTLIFYNTLVRLFYP